MSFANIEGIQQFNFVLPNRVKKPGVAAIIRAKNEEDKIAYALGSVYDVFDQIVVVDNASTDGTRRVIEMFKKQFDHAGKIELFTYPFQIARCGPEHGATPENSVHSIVYFTNYAMSKCSVKTLCRWDADMFLRADARDDFAQFMRRIGRGTQFRWGIVGQSLFRDLDGNFHTCDSKLDMEPRIFPCSYFNRFVKRPVFEVLYSPLYRRVFQRPSYYELKFAEADELSHWSTDDLPTSRISTERDVLRLLSAGQAPGEEYVRYDRDFLAKQISYDLKHIDPSNIAPQAVLAAASQ